MTVSAEKVTGADRLVALLKACPLDRLEELQDKWMSGLPDFARERVDRLVAERLREGHRADPWTLARWLEGEEVVKDWAYSRYLADAYRRAQTGESRFQVWNLPAQVGKSTWLQRGVLWHLDVAPDEGIQYLTYGNRLAVEASDFILTRARTFSDKLGFDLKPDRQTQNVWRTTEGGGLLAVSLGGSVAGFSASGGVIVDDPIKNWAMAHSQSARDSAMNEIAAVARLRLSGGAFLILAHTRWHLDDPTGRMKALASELGLEVEFVTMPMHARLGDLLGREVGELLAPERYDEAEAKSRAQFLGSYLTAAMEEQDPIPETGGEFKRADWCFYSSETPSSARWCSSWDMKLKDKETGDFVVGLAVARLGAGYRITAMLRGQYSFRSTKIAIALMKVRNPQIERHYIENTGNGPEVIADLRKPDPTFMLTDEDCAKLGISDRERRHVTALIRAGISGLIPRSANDGTKIVRARKYTAPKLEASNLYLPGSPELATPSTVWAHLVIDEHAAFPPKAGGHDDIVDALSQALRELGDDNEASTTSPPQRSIAVPPAGRKAGGVTRAPTRVIGRR